MIRCPVYSGRKSGQNLLSMVRSFPGENPFNRGNKRGKQAGKAARNPPRLKQLERASARICYSCCRSHRKTAAALIREARNGNVRAFEIIRDTIGEKPRERVEMAVAKPQFEALDAAFREMTRRR